MVIPKTCAQGGDFACDHWALWAGLFAFFTPQIFAAKCLAISSLCALLSLILGLWLLRKSSFFKNRVRIALFICIPAACFVQIQNHGLRDIEPGVKVGRFTLSDLRSSSKGTMWLSGLFHIQPSDAKKGGQKLRLSLEVERKKVDLTMGCWKVTGKLMKKPLTPTWQLICALDEKWEAAPTPFSKICARWALWRQSAKTKVTALLTTALPPTRARAFINGLLTGQQPDQRLGHLLSRVGLAHLMAVSGFHFACVLAASGLLLHLMRLHHPAHLLFPLALYFAYMGPSASVFRAAVMAICRIISQCRKCAYRPLQGLGMGILLWCLLWPECTGELGFLLSYLCTAALLLLMQPIEQLICGLWPLLKKRSSRSVYDRFWTMCRGALSANLSAHIATIAPQLYFWHFFPLASLWFNLLLPPCIGLIMPLLLIGCGLALISPLLGHALLRLCHAALVPLLRLTDVPRPWESLIWAEVNLGTAAWSTAALLTLGLMWHRLCYEDLEEGLKKWIS